MRKKSSVGEDWFDEDTPPSTDSSTPPSTEGGTPPSNITQHHLDTTRGYLERAGSENPLRNPYLRQDLAGTAMLTAGGAGVGSILGMLLDRNRRDPEQRRPGRSALLGALVGAAVPAVGLGPYNWMKNRPQRQQMQEFSNDPEAVRYLTESVMRGDQ